MPILPELVAILCWDIAEFSVASGGRLRQPNSSTVSLSTCAQARRAIREIHLLPTSSHVSGRPYDLQHAAASLCHNAGVPARTVAHRAGHPVEALLRVYVNYFDVDDEIANERIQRAQVTLLHSQVATSVVEAPRAFRQSVSHLVRPTT